MGPGVMLVSEQHKSPFLLYPLFVACFFTNLWFHDGEALEFGTDVLSIMISTEGSKHENQTVFVVKMLFTPDYNPIGMDVIFFSHFLVLHNLWKQSRSSVANFDLEVIQNVTDICLYSIWYGVVMLYSQRQQLGVAKAFLRAVPQVLLRLHVDLATNWLFVFTVCLSSLLLLTHCWGHKIRLHNTLLTINKSPHWGHERPHLPGGRRITYGLSSGEPDVQLNLDAGSSRYQWIHFTDFMDSESRISQ
ncbi:hypothetical protein CRM22_005914 [Opisthorchis felineus]|uniref:Uncharacterized protein n=1 Tax=Opisthorchis felineus TaxID=147828 RepID=A0A4S2LNU1_OPIFE|nr:hypothetical protein CRM22_005914 [Opisthorchis felineus]